MGLSFGQRGIFLQSKQQIRRNTLCISRICCDAMRKKNRWTDGKNIFELPWNKKPDRLQSDPSVIPQTIAKSAVVTTASIALHKNICDSPADVLCRPSTAGSGAYGTSAVSPFLPGGCLALPKSTDESRASIKAIKFFYILPLHNGSVNSFCDIFAYWTTIISLYSAKL